MTDPAIAARDALLKILDESGHAQQRLDAAGLLLHHAGLFHAMEEANIPAPEEELASFFVWLQSTALVPSGSYDVPVIINAYLEREDDA